MTNIPVITFAVIWPYLRALLIFILGLIIVKLIKKYQSRFMAKINVEPLAYRFIEHVIVIVVWIVIALTIASTLGIETNSVLTLFAAAGAAVALAIQDSLSNLFGGFIVMASSILEKGDYISVGDVEGTVDSIDLLHTTIITPDNKIITVPNATMNKTSIINYTKSETRRVEVTIGIAYESDSEQARYVLTQMAMEDDRVLKDPQPCCHVMNYADSSVVLTLRAWVRSEDYWDVTFYFKNNIKAVLSEAGVIMPFPQLDVHFDKEQREKMVLR